MKWVVGYLAVRCIGWLGLDLQQRRDVNSNDYLP